MKNTLTAIISSIFLLCLLIGNAAITAMSMNNDNVIQTIAEEQGKKDEVRLPVLMYHHVLKDTNRCGDYVISPTQLENDLMELFARGYTPVTTDDIIAYVEAGEKLPEKPILVTFDDGYESFYAYAYPLLIQYNTPAVVSIIGKYTDLYSGDVTKSLSYAHANWEQLREMQGSNLIEIGNHTYDMHHNDGSRKGIKKLSSESIDEYRLALTSDIGALSSEMESELTVKPKSFAYPFGAHSKESDMILKELGFKIVFTCEEKVNKLQINENQNEEILRLNRFNRAGKYSTKSFFDSLDH